VGGAGCNERVGTMMVLGGPQTSLSVTSPFGLRNAGTIPKCFVKLVLHWGCGYGGDA